MGALVLTVLAWWQGRDDAPRSGDGTITGAGDVAAEDLRVGDCLLEPETEEFESTAAVPCDSPHDLEIFHAYSVPAGPYPDDEDVFAHVEDECIPAFGRFVGLDYAESLYYLDVLTPTVSGWTNGDHEFLCYLYLEDVTAVESAAGTRR